MLIPWGKCLKYILKVNTKPSRQHDSNFVKNMSVYIVKGVQGYIHTKRDTHIPRETETQRQREADFFG